MTPDSVIINQHHCEDTCLESTLNYTCLYCAAGVLLVIVVSEVLNFIQSTVFIRYSGVLAGEK